ncbi:hypothetical protein HNQ92_000763 [Rhabdobacter roseus]|uniref:Uncharacterized protein n=1 Tax=Rhabdobacter roseus TaxID=1655419 RepID=A0A840TM59_9BACT|nr:hypothetical protein [Rhabdobacter roseus]
MLKQFLLNIEGIVNYIKGQLYIPPALAFALQM